VLQTIEAVEVDEFSSAVAGLTIDYIRTDAGSGPCRVTTVDSGSVQLSTGSMGFSAVAGTEIPSDLGVFALIRCAPEGSTWCGTELAEGQLFFLAPGTTFLAAEPEGLAATILAVRYAELGRTADEHCRTFARHSVRPLGPSNEADLLRETMSRVAVDPASALHRRWAPTTLEVATAAVTSERTSVHDLGHRRLDSGKIVADAIDWVESSWTYRPTMSELCRATHASESRVRLAFVEAVGVPPSQYFQRRLLSRFRNDLLDGDPASSSVTEIATALGVTQFGRMAGRYRQAYGELPSDTLRRHRRHGVGALR